MSSRDRICQRRDDHEGSSPGRRRLRFSFQINDVKDPIGSLRPRRFAPGGRRGAGCLVAPIFAVNRIAVRPELPRIGAQSSLGASRGLPLSVRGESIEGAETKGSALENQGPIGPWTRALRSSVPSEGRHISAPSGRRKPSVGELSAPLVRPVSNCALRLCCAPR